MKRLLYGTTLAIPWILLSLTAGWAQEASGPKMVLEEKHFVARPINEGEIIEHAFAVRNLGDRPLEIEKVNPGWGCAVARFDRTILPGGEGKITLRVNTRGYQGELRKSARVYTNDPRKRVEVLSITAFVKVLISLSPRYAYLRGLADQKITQTVKVRAEGNKPLRLEPSRFDFSTRVTYRIEEVEPGRVFKVHFTSIPGPAGTYWGALQLKTNYPEKPVITIPIRARFREEPKG